MIPLNAGLTDLDRHVSETGSLPLRILTHHRRRALATSLPEAEFSANAEKAARAETKIPVIQGIATGTQRATVQAWHLRTNERDLKNRKRFGWTDNDAKADWPHAA